MKPSAPVQTDAHSGLAPERERVPGWDMLRGLCALAVASYHLLYWQGLASLHTLGSYGVYLFFILSGASLSYTYADGFRRRGDVLAFVVTRWLRLAPLYLLLCIVFVAMLSQRDGQLVDQLGWRTLLNASFGFGLVDPAIWALLIGGWSLGIEFVYYLAFPAWMSVVGRGGRGPMLWLVLCALQWFWILHTAGSDAGYAASAVAYHQIPAFGAYFFGGCLIGQWRRVKDLRLPTGWGIAVWVGMGALLLALNPLEQGDELLGWRGMMLFVACFAVVALSGQVRLDGGAQACARWLGDITYGCYLMHPLVFFGFAWFVLPHVTEVEIQDMPTLPGLVLVAVVLTLSCWLAKLSERHLETPLRHWGRRKLFGRKSRSKGLHPVSPRS